jgi:hypothetical protein
MEWGYRAGPALYRWQSGHRQAIDSQAAVTVLPHFAANADRRGRHTVSAARGGIFGIVWGTLDEVS